MTGHEWNNGSEVGTMTGLGNCKEECDKHPECLGFTYNAVDNICGNWKGGPLELKPSSGNYCFNKTTISKFFVLRIKILMLIVMLINLNKVIGRLNNYDN